MTQNDVGNRSSEGASEHLASCCCPSCAQVSEKSKKSGSKVISAEDEAFYTAQAKALDAIREAHRNPRPVSSEMAERHRLSPSERLAPYLAQTPQPVLDHLERVEADRAELLREVARLTKIVERYVGTLPSKRAGGATGGRGNKKDGSGNQATHAEIDAEIASVIRTSGAPITSRLARNGRQVKAIIIDVQIELNKKKKQAGERTIRERLREWKKANNR